MSNSDISENSAYSTTNNFHSPMNLSENSVKEICTNLHTMTVKVKTLRINWVLMWIKVKKPLPVQWSTLDAELE